ncbi:MAG: hypothetical protein ABIH83_03200 [Candidatus Micrarchaeota archaeon]
MDMLLSTSVSLPFEILRISLAIAGTAIGTYFDLFNKKNVPELFLYAFLAAAFLLNLIAYNETATIYGIGTGIVVFAAFYLLYKFGQLGGADVYIMASIALLLPIQPTISPFLYPAFLLTLPFILDIILASGISFMLYMLLRSIPIAINSLTTPGKIEKKSLFGAFLIVLAFGIFSYISSQSMFIPSSYFLFLSIMVLLSLYFTLFKNAINDSMAKLVKAKEVEQEDILAIDKINKKLVKKYMLARLVDAPMLKRIKKMKEKIAVYKHLPPFIPHILIGLIVSILFGNIVIFLSSFL